MKEILMAALNAVRLQYEDELPGGVAGLSRLTDEGYEIVLKRGLAPAEEEFVLLHELLHVTRGDLLARVTDDDVCSTCRIPAEEATINAAIRREHPELMPPYECVEWPQLRPRLEQLFKGQFPESMPRWVGREWLTRELHQTCGGMIGMTLCAMEIDEDIDIGDAVRVHADAMDRMPEEIQRLAGKGAARPKASPPEPDYQRMAAIAAIVQEAERLSRHSASYGYSRSWKREGRLPVLKGVAARPHPTVAVALDLSGSMTELEPLAQAIASAFRNSYIVGWDTAVRGVWKPGQVPDIGGAGGGTDPDCVFGELPPGVDTVVFVTDGYLTSAYKGPVNVVWAVVGSAAPDVAKGTVYHV